MISLRSIKYYILTNSSIILLSYIQYSILNYYNFTYLSCFIANIIKISLLTIIIYLLSYQKKYYTDGVRNNIFSITDYVKTTSIDTLSFYLIVNNIATLTTNIGNDIIYFIPKSFIFELIFDFCHYWMHRTLHMYPILYINIHKKHHNDKLIDIYTTFSHTIPDYLLTNTLPLIITSSIIPMTTYQITIQFMYKVLLEIAGHSGKVNKSSSFAQCIWLPRLFNIELKTNDHNTHHINAQYNFSKRFSIWYKLYGTYYNQSK